MRYIMILMLETRRKDSDGDTLTYSRPISRETSKRHSDQKEDRLETYAPDHIVILCSSRFS